MPAGRGSHDACTPNVLTSGRGSRDARTPASPALPFSADMVILKRMLQYSPQVQPPIDVLFHALSDANRRAMIDRLLDGPASVSELARPLSISLPAVVQHLHVLEASGVVRSHKVGRVRTCEVEPLALNTAERWISERRALWETRLDRLGEYLEKGEPHG
jgi:DNA-binding transcriptional ArsR family regulator